jgi:hypothetical protein
MIAVQRRALASRLEARHREIADGLLTRLRSLTGASLDADLDETRAFIDLILEYGFSSIGAGKEAPLGVPARLLLQAREAAQARVPIDTILRRYFASFTLMNSFFFEEADQLGLKTSTLYELMHDQLLLFDHLVASIARAYWDEGEKLRHGGPERKLVESVQALLDGQLIDATSIAYDFDGHHVGAVGAGEKAAETLRALASRLDRRLLLVKPTAEVVWAWFGGSRALTWGDIEPQLPVRSGVALSFGGPGAGLSGWRLTHRQAKAALSVAVRKDMIVQYFDVALHASVIQDDLLSTSLREIYLEPLSSGRDGEMLRKTLSAYFEAGRNVSSAAALLGVKRHTVTNRLRTVEDILGRPLGACAVALELALDIERLAE